MKQTLAIEVSELTKSYGDHVALKGISFTVRTGEVFVLVGPNGAGKTTAVECMEGLRDPDGGTIRILRMDPRRDRERLFRSVGVQLQENALHPRLKVREALEVFSSFYESPVPTGEILEQCGLAGRENDFYGKLSGGQKRRLLLALALIGRPRLVILDEPTSGLDPQARFNVWRLLREIRKNGTTVFLTTHYLDEAEDHADTLCILDRGEVVAMGNPKELLRKNRMETRIRLPVQPKLNEAELRNLPGVVRVERVDDHFFVYGDSDDLYAGLAERLGNRGLSRSALEMRRAGLEDLYLILTGREYRKE